MNRRLIVAILIISTLPVYAQGQQPNAAKLKADAQKVVTIISSDTAKFHSYCQIVDLADEVEGCPYRKPKRLTRTRESVDSSLDERSFQVDLVWLDRTVPVAGCVRSRNPSAPASAQHSAARNAEAGRPWQH
jgi:hypothetical protein